MTLLPEQTQTIGEDDRWLINWFFGRLKIVYDVKFSTKYATPNDVALGKREWASMILQHTQADLGNAIELAKERRLKGDDDFDWPDIPKILGLLHNNHSINSGAYVEFGTPDHPAYKRPAIEDMGKKARLDKVKSQTLSNLKDLLK
jgi:hypothetical protein